MQPALQSLESSRIQLYRKLEALGDFRRGIISANYRKCGKSNCACAQKDHPGHGPQYLWNASADRVGGGRESGRFESATPKRKRAPQVKLPVSL